MPASTCFYWTKSSFPLCCRKQTVQHFLSVFWLWWYYSGDIVYMHTATSTIKPHNTVYHSALGFITGCRVMTCQHHCMKTLGWTSLTLRREQHCTVLKSRTLFTVYLKNWQSFFIIQLLHIYFFKLFYSFIFCLYVLLCMLWGVMFTALFKKTACS